MEETLIWRVFGTVLFVALVAALAGCVGLLLLDAMLVP